ncbi:MAG: hypothetical protein A3A04_00230 [Candidatus Harrisonbacteria bacterium RIFCSPLOWO2_01_FULL_40_28]|uniref:Uncharacterized protein n=2 Tax=Candidatus Harrisoniibacteriota TaxID=1817905 RepID=A0A1G2A037_9BACT|nr:MAG: hypothetical protein A3A04_00230 [Candidatus Harrisonbacteria bacterium RIFCSPLOWO2_01_FULL_40_28]OGY69517.1 MAG: hypothetical protein A2586_00355 [Candidatus Harrisonbacteria bacterium RIFOXYD1_FULL_40_9]
MDFENISEENKEEKNFKEVFESEHASVGWAEGGQIYTTVVEENGEYVVYGLLENQESYKGDWIGDAPDAKHFKTKEEAISYAQKMLENRENWLSE